MNIAKFDYRNRAPISGEFRIREPEQHRDAKGAPYLHFSIEDYSGEMYATGWHNNITDAEKLEDFDCISLNGQLQKIEGSWRVNVASAELLQDDPEHPALLIPRSFVPEPSVLEELDEYANCITHPALKAFIGWVLTDLEISIPFVNLPASREHHHSFAGGLIEHSLHCALIVSQHHEFPQYELELAMIGALLHDVGKIRTLQNVGKLTTTGYMIDHDALILEVLGAHLQQLDTICPDAGVALRYLWTWRMQRNSRLPMLTIAEAISAADKISCGLDRQKAAFQTRPDWHTFAKVAENSTFWRPKLKLVTEESQHKQTTYKKGATL